MLKESLQILTSLYPNREIIQRANTSYDMYISGKENFIIGVDTKEEDKLYFCAFPLQNVREQNEL